MRKVAEASHACFPGFLRKAVTRSCRKMAHGIPSQGKVTIAVDEYSSNPTQAFTHYNINQSRFQPPHVHMVDPIPYDTPKPAGHTRFVCISDTHSRTDGIQMPYGDILLHTGDFTELGLPSEVKKFNDWLGNLPYEYKIVIAGNHELTFDKEFMADLVKQDYYRFPSVSKLKPEDFDNVQALLTNSIYLQDSEVTVKGFRIYGAPWTPWFNGWGFNLPRGQSLLDKWNLVPEGIDILMTHGPPLGYGIMTDGYTTYINASTCTVSFQPTNPPIIFDLPNPQGS
ncbi:metallophosphoesterase MPPED2 isoform X2 [Octodon degus]|uniref:Metallophosphoesterase MPPED2 isoform X2 n=1 Tax=Octodon degus TaxID=10160 RepID=A0A6P6DJY8_OCTDE|nr:metallophosphoesterase MPPED2 isoform X2 [Octodon degus]